LSWYPQQYEIYYPSGYYWPLFFQELIPVVVGIAVMVAMGAWALSLARKAFKGEEVKFPL
jgi:hypothetical protein